MKTFDVSGEKVSAGITVSQKPYPHVTLGEGGNKRATWVPLGNRDAEGIVVPAEDVLRPETEWEVRSRLGCTSLAEAREAMAGGDVQQKVEKTIPAHIDEVGVIALRDKKTGEYNGRHLIVAPRGQDNRALILWRVSSGYRGGADITAGDGVRVVAEDSAWHSGRGSLGSTAEMLAVLSPGQELRASRSGRRVQSNRARLTWDGEEVKVVFGDDSLFIATGADEEPEGEYL